MVVRIEGLPDLDRPTVTRPQVDQIRESEFFSPEEATTLLSLVPLVYHHEDRERFDRRMQQNRDAALLHVKIRLKRGGPAGFIGLVDSAYTEMAQRAEQNHDQPGLMRAAQWRNGTILRGAQTLFNTPQEIQAWNDTVREMDAKTTSESIPYRAIRYV